MYHAFLLIPIIDEISFQRYNTTEQLVSVISIYWGDSMDILRGKRGRAVFLTAILLLAVFLFWKQSQLDEKIAVMSQQQPVLIIDAGHGGADGGASTAEGVLESSINLEIALKLDVLARLYGKETVLTRETAGIDYPSEADTVAKQKVYDQKTRVALINGYPDGILISIHQNFYPDTRPKGAQVLYGHTPESEVFGKLLHVNLVAALDPTNRRVAAPIDENIYLMRNVQCTAALVECGFLSNPEEALQLEENTYQNKISVVLLASYLEYLNNTAV